MTDWTAIARALDAVARREAHEQTCEYWGEHRFRHDCMCDHAQRVREAQAKALARALEEAIDAASFNGAMRMDPGMRHADPDECFLTALRGIG